MKHKSLSSLPRSISEAIRLDYEELFNEEYTPPMKADDILREGIGLLGERGETYDKDGSGEERSMESAVQAFSHISGVEMTESQGWLFMAVLKMVRSQSGKFNHDDYPDGCNYMALSGEAAHKERGSNND